MQIFPNASFWLYVKGKPLKWAVNTFGRETNEFVKIRKEILCACVQRGYRKMFRIWGYSESRATFTLIFKCPNSTFWRALTTGQSSLLIPAPSHELKRNIIYTEINRQRYISCGELKAETSALMGIHLANQ